MVMGEKMSFVRAVIAFLWKRLKYTMVGWQTWWYVFIPGEFLNVALGVATWYFFTNYLISAGEVKDIVAYIVLGMGVNTVLRSALVHLYWAVHGLYSGYLESGGFRMRYWEYYSLAGIPRYVAILGFMLFDSMRSLVSLVLYLLVGSLLFGISFGGLQSYAPAILLLVAGYLATFTLGIFVACTFWFFVRYRELTLNPFIWVIDVLVPVVCGIYYPRNVLPRFLAHIGDFLPQTYAIEGLRAVLGVSGGDLFLDVSVLLAYIAMLPLAVWVFRASESRALRRSGIL